jgi:hypothetical protein
MTQMIQRNQKVYQQIKHNYSFQNTFAIVMMLIVPTGSLIEENIDRVV